MKKISLKLHIKITILVSIIVLLSICTTILFATRWTIQGMQQELETNMMNMAKVLAQAPSVVDGMEQGYERNSIQPYIQKILKTTDDIEIIVVANMEGIRYAHPNPNRLGLRFVGGDDKKVLEEGVSYISEAVGTLGRSIRAFVPIYDEEGKQLGFVMVGTLTQSISVMKTQTLLSTILASFIGLFFGIMGAILLAKRIKKTLFGLEPEEISKLYVEKEGMLDAIHEGIISIDSKANVTLVNDSAIKLLKINQKNYAGRSVKEIFPTSRLPEVLKSGIAEYNREQVINDTIIITNRVPIRQGDEIVGAIATFRDKTMITKLAEEVTGVRQVVDALRANTHEFMNKLHVILGLIEINELEEAKKYILDTQQRQQQIVGLVAEKIKDATIAGLLLGKFSRAKELAVHMEIEGASYLNRRSGKINSNTLVTIIGNLIENAMEAVVVSEKEEKTVHIFIKESKKNIRIEVKDTGNGIEEAKLKIIFKRGFSTKEGSNGVGLALVKETVENLGGNIEVLSNVGRGTKFTIVIPKEEAND